jgi:hypothetical protein
VDVEFFSSRSQHVLHIEQDGNWIQGSHKGDFTVRDLVGMIEGDKVTLRSVERLPGDSVTYIFSGTLADGALSGPIHLGGTDREFTAKRHLLDHTHRILVPGGRPSPHSVGITMPHAHEPGSRRASVLRGAGGAGKRRHGRRCKARDHRLDRLVAVKILPPAMAMSRDAGAVRAGGPRVPAFSSQCVRAVRRGPRGRDLVLVMELLDGETLKARRRRPLEMPEVLRIGSGRRSAGGRQGRIAHRDLKPANVMVTRSGSSSSTSD